MWKFNAAGYSGDNDEDNVNDDDDDDDASLFQLFTVGYFQINKFIGFMRCQFLTFELLDYSERDGIKIIPTRLCDDDYWS